MARSKSFQRLLLNMKRAVWLENKPEQATRALQLLDAQKNALSRRDFLRYAGVASVTTAASGLLSPGASEAARLLKGPPVAIVGAGLAGLTVAYRLSKAGVPCEMFEASERVGGRVFTHYRFNSEGMFCELGGELVDTNHEALIGLAQELGIEIEELRTGDDGADLYHVGGRFYSDEDFINSFRPLARRLRAVLAQIKAANGDMLPAASKWDNTSLAEFFDQARKDTDAWVVDMLSAAYTSEYGMEPSEQSCLNLILFIGTEDNVFHVFGESDESKRVKGGSSRLVQALLKRVQGRVKIHHGHELVAMRSKGSGMQLNFHQRGKASANDRFCARAVLALPFTLLRETDLAALGLPSDKLKCFHEMGYGRNAKAMYGFKSRFWRQASVALGKYKSNGQVISDLRLQSVWETSRKQVGQAGILTNFVGGNAVRDIRGVERFKSEMENIFPGIKSQFVDSAHVVMDWPSYRWTKASYSAPRPGQYLQYANLAGRAELSNKLQFVGEHTSEGSAGYMNGAVESGERAAKAMLS